MAVRRGAGLDRAHALDFYGAEMISDEERYQWLRKRIKIVNMVSMSGKMKPGLYVCLGAVFLDTPFDGTEKDAVKLDTAINAAILTTGVL